MEDSFWIFGYGSLIWKPEFPYEKRCLGYVTSYKRQFSQLSVTHRGTPDKPGRVATLIPSDNPDARVWGYAYKIVDPSSIAIAKKQLFEREVKGGDYYAVKVPFFYHTSIDGSSLSPSDDATSRVMITYVANPNSHLYSDNVDIIVQASEISTASGWCGPNTDYLYRLVEFMRTDVPQEFAKRDDPYLFELEYLVKILVNRMETNHDLPV